MTRAADPEYAVHVIQFVERDADRRAGEVEAMRSFEIGPVNRYPTTHADTADGISEAELERLRRTRAGRDRDRRHGRRHGRPRRGDSVPVARDRRRRGD
jgi:hypothetical protein